MGEAGARELEVKAPDTYYNVTVFDTSNPADMGARYRCVAWSRVETIIRDAGTRYRQFVIEPTFIGGSLVLPYVKS